MTGKKVILVIMDGWGFGKIKSSDAIQAMPIRHLFILYMQISQYNFNNLRRSGWIAGRTNGKFRSWSFKFGAGQDCLPGIATNQCCYPRRDVCQKSTIAGFYILCATK